MNPLEIEYQFQLIFCREETDEKEQRCAEKLRTMKEEYERYKDQWGLNLQYSHSAGPTHNFSELYLAECKIFTLCFSREKEPGSASGAHLL